MMAYNMMTARSAIDGWLETTVGHRPSAPGQVGDTEEGPHPVLEGHNGVTVRHCLMATNAVQTEALSWPGKQIMTLWTLRHGILATNKAGS